jgi:16S rRNA pseudouridine516 synthase
MARLDRLLANLGYGSRREVTDLVARRQVVLDGAVVKDAGATYRHRRRPSGAHDRRRPAARSARAADLLMHKPLGVVCSHREAGAASMNCCRRAGARASRRSPPSAGSTRRPRACC